MGETIAAPAYGSDHRSFMDYAYQSGLMVIFPLVSDVNMLRDLTATQFESYMMNQVIEPKKMV